MKLRKGDKVEILSGKDAGKTGKILQIFTKEKMASVEGLNLAIKHMRRGKQSEKGQKIQFPAPLSLSKLILVCPKCHRKIRVSYRILENKTKIRICKKCKETI